MNSKTVEGVMIVKNGKAWARQIAEHYGGDGYVNLVDGEVFNGKYITEPSDVTYLNSPYISCLEGAEIVKVRRTTHVELL